MRVCSLDSVKNQITLGEPLPFSVRDANRLLLTRGEGITDEAQLQSLIQLGAMVEFDELADALQMAQREPPSRRRVRLPAEWARVTAEVKQALCGPPAQMMSALDSVTDQLLLLIDLSPELALSQVVRQPVTGSGHYGVNHSIHAATACHAAARLLGWQAHDQRQALQAALTMNLAILDLQARLADQVSPLTAKQREVIHEHPIRGAELLSMAGVTDATWLEAVRTHHEVPDGSGYPRRQTDVGELAEMLRFADVYTAQLSRRANRAAMSPHQAGRRLHQMSDSSPLTFALIKAFGVYPPGSMVRLASGELGVVVRNGEKVHRPLVATLTNAAGEPTPTTVLRDSANDDHAVTALLSPQAMPVWGSDERLAELIDGA